MYNNNKGDSSKGSRGGSNNRGRSSGRSGGGNGYPKKSGGFKSGGYNKSADGSSNNNSSSSNGSYGGNRGGGSRGGRGGNSYGRNRGGGNRGRFGGGRSGGRGGNRGGRGGGNRFKSKNMHPGMYVLPAQPMVEQPSIYVEDKTYDDFNLEPRLKQNLKARKYINPTKIQDLAIPPALEGNDVLAQASTGSGKTGAFLVPMVNKIMEDPRQKCLIILPTRELAQQTQMELEKLTPGTNIKSTIIIGGVSMVPQRRQMSRHPNFVIATPGRLKDLWQQKIINLNDYNNVVLDEVDRMLDMGFINDIRLIISKLRDDRQSLFVSATMTPEAEKLATELLRNPVKVQTAKQAPQASVNQDVVRVPQGADKVTVLHELLIQQSFEKVLIFSQTKRGAEKLSKILNGKGHRVDAIHGDKSQSKRTRVIEMYRANKINILVATDVVARGLDVKDISHVINFDEPNSYEDYIHRIGRTGRIGKTGTALTFLDKD